ncbi:hypothetical protein [Paraburkholderia fungorum]|uniref:hypothetical protein n=1 Tax=Paraburkholderia fungorum TaxID=134537 RepID=UPI0038BC702D
MSAARRIDVHQHVVPPFWADELPSNGGASSLSFENSEIRIRERSDSGHVIGDRDRLGKTRNEQQQG